MPGHYTVRAFSPDDYYILMKLEETIFASQNEPVLGPFYLRLCCEFYGEHCFLAFVEEQAAGYILCFVHERKAYCTTMAIIPEYQGSRVAGLLIQQLIMSLLPCADSIWFTVKEDNHKARRLHAKLGAREMGTRKDFYWPGDDRIVSVIDRHTLNQLRERYQRLRLIPLTENTTTAQPLAEHHPSTFFSDH
jgi:ribosomal protein S18 acetylase RimI-like enzyme